MEKNKFLCPECGAEMYETYDKPALNFTCPKCGCKIATTRWEKIDIDDTEYEIHLLPEAMPSISHIKIISKIAAKNFIASKEALINGEVIFKGKAVEIRQYRSMLDKNEIKYKIIPDFSY